MNDAYFHLLMCRSVVTALHSHKCEQSSQPLLLLTKHWCVWTLARSQHVYSESGPAVHFLLWIGSYPLFNTRAEWVHKCRQETIHCAHVFSENTDKLEAVTFTHGHVSEVKQASRAAAAGCVTATPTARPAQISHRHHLCCKLFHKTPKHQSELWISSSLRRGEEARLWFLLSPRFNVKSKTEIHLFKLCWHLEDWSNTNCFELRLVVPDILDSVFYFQKPGKNNKFFYSFFSISNKIIWFNCLKRWQLL